MCWGCQLGNASFYPPLRTKLWSSRKRTRIPLTSSGSSTQCLATRNQGNNSARQTRDTTTRTWIAHGNSTWRASKYKVQKLHQRYMFKTKQKKECPQWQIYPPFRHTRRQVCTGLFLFETGHRPCPSSAVIFLGSLIRQSCLFLDVEALWCMTKTLSPIERGTWAYV